MTQLGIKRVYAQAEPADGLRVLVDRLWPRGLSKDEAAVDRWVREIAPSTALRQWFGHDPAKWDAFQHRYRAELDARPEDVALLRRVLDGHARATLLYAAKDEAHNHALTLCAYLRGR